MDKELVSMNFKGIKCDNPDCDYEDMEVEFDPEYYLNKPCPECGWNLFTQQDYDSLKQMIAATEHINSALQDLAIDVDGPQVSADVEMDGSGKINLSLPELEPTIKLVDLLPWLESVSKDSYDEWMWVKNTQCKYVTLIIDTRHGGSVLVKDRDDNNLSLEELMWQYKGEEDE